MYRAMATRWRVLTRKLAEAAGWREPEITAQQAAWLSDAAMPGDYVDYIEEREHGVRVRFAAAVAYSDRPLDSHNLMYAMSPVGLRLRIDDKTSRLARQHARRLVRGIGGVTSTCPHIRASVPLPVIGHVRGSRLDCLHCFPQTLDEMTEREADACDACRKSSPLQVLDLLLPHIGSVTLIIGMCHDCVREMCRATQKRGPSTVEGTASADAGCQSASG
jgi:hypothetical protein